MESIQSYIQIIDSLQTSTYSRSTNQQALTPHNYGGAFIDDNGFLNINLKDSSFFLEKEASRIADNDTLIFHNASYSLSELTDVYDYLKNSLFELSIKEVYISETKNRIVLSVEDKFAFINQIKNYIDINILHFNEENFTFENSATYDLKGGEAITCNSSSSTLSFCAEDTNGKPGIVVSGHGVDAVGDSVYNSSGVKIGTVTKRYFTGLNDCAFVEIKNRLFTKFNPTYLLSDNTGVWSWLPESCLPEGAQLTKYGAYGGIRSGEVISNSATMSYGGLACVDMVKTSIYSIAGDSGAPVVKKTLSGNCYVGTVRGIATYTNGTVETYFVKIEHTLNVLGNPSLYLSPL